MKKLLFFFAMMISLFSYGGNGDDSLAIIQKFKDSIEHSLRYETGTIKLPGDMVTLNVPQGFKFLNKEQSNFVLTELWGNPPQNAVLGMLFPENGGAWADSSYAFVISFDEMGYVKDEDADKIDYTQMLKDDQTSEQEENKTRAKEGYPSIHIVGWAQQPFYDKSNKILHWAREIEFGDADKGSANTLNYDVRVLGRKGVLILKAVATMNEMSVVKADIPKILHIATFTEGNKYSDFDPGIDKVAAWTIGSLVAGKVLAKVGVLALIGKYLVAGWKFIVLGIVAAWGVIMKFFKRKKREPEDELVESEFVQEETNNAENETEVQKVEEKS